MTVSMTTVNLSFCFQTRVGKVLLAEENPKASKKILGKAHNTHTHTHTHMQANKQTNKQAGKIAKIWNILETLVLSNQIQSAR